MTLTVELTTKYDALRTHLAALARVVVAFSGGVDSTLLLKVALDVLGADAVLAIIGDSESYPAQEFSAAQALAESLGARYRVIRCEELHNPAFAANPANRCYYCKSELFGRLVAIAQADGYRAVLDGNNADDTGDWRPGRQAGCELGVRSPLLEAGLTKAEIRDLSQALGLSTWDKPAYACLASRIPYGTPITAETLQQIEQAELVLHGIGLRQVRVRHHGEVARLEMLPAEMPRLFEPAVRAEVSARLHALGYRFVTLDLDGYRMGSFNPPPPA
jgi:uncharacterized protein